MGFGLLAVCLSIPSICAWIIPCISSYACKTTNYVLSALALLTWYTVLVLILRGPVKRLITMRVPAALSSYADAGASVLVIPFLSFVFALMIVIVIEMYLYRIDLLSQAKVLRGCVHAGLVLCLT